MNTELIKKKILDLAIKGKLVEQQPEEGTAEDLYNQIQEEKKKLIAEGKIKKEKPLPEISEDEITFDIPQSWKWVRIGDLANYKKGPFGSALTKSIFVPKSDKAIKVYEQKNAIQKDANLGSYYITREYFEERMKSFEVVAGDIIVSCAGTIGEIYKLPAIIEKGIINQALMRIRLFEPTYCEYYELLFDYLIKDYSRKSSKGSAIKNIPPFEILKKYVIPLPPLAEQKRIVDKVVEIFSRIDVIEKAKADLAKDGNLLEKKILDLAIRGKLVEQRPEEGTAEELYAQIQEEKKKLLAEGKIKKEKPLPEITEEEIPFDIPESWKWVRLKQLVDIQNGDRGKNYPAKETLHEQGIPFISAINLEHNTVISDSKLKCLDDIQYERLRAGKLQVNDLVVCIRGSLGKHAKYPFEKGAIASSLVILRKYLNDETIAEFIAYYLDSWLFFEEIGKYNNGTAQPNLAANDLEKFVIPLPPLAEQKRIVKRIEELLPYCYKLKE